MSDKYTCLESEIKRERERDKEKEGKNERKT